MLQAFNYRTYIQGEQHNMLVWGRMQDIRPQPTDWIKPNCPAPLRVPFVTDGRIGWADPNKLTLLDSGDAQPSAASLEVYGRAVK